MPFLHQLTSALPDAQIIGNREATVAGVVYDSRRAKTGDAFVCIRGFKLDGHNFIPDALQRGAHIIVGEEGERLRALPASVTKVIVSDARLALARMAAEFYGHPSRALKVVGVTGTNGKTTTAHLIGAMLREAGSRVGVIGTIGVYTDEGAMESAHTTPESVDLQAMFAEFKNKGIEAVVMEVSSHACALRRVEGVAFDVGVFTNLTQDHLDFHSDIEDYFRAKAMLFSDYANASAPFKPFGGVVNGDDCYGHRLVDLCAYPVMRYGVESSADLVAEGLRMTPRGMSFVVRSDSQHTEVNMQLTGRFNVYNALAAFGAGRILGLAPEICRRGLASVAPPPGRLEMIDEGQDFTVAVDYAHTPDGLQKVISAVREFTRGRLIVVFGCGGDRDRRKRPLMGAVVSRFADVAVITSDNPRSEEPLAIIAEIQQGTREGNAECMVEPDRRQAIEQAIALAREGDFVLIAGKGHETYQIFRDRTVRFDDREVAREILRRAMQK
jgi:UDP-N-acetylmuramoyl-L-alanyl-D-glutamate--2,6-diaminopimelate ligase